jgi:hypothetical protein
LEAFEVGREQLEPDRFGEIDWEYRLVWRVALDFYLEYGSLPTKDHMLAELQDRIANDPAEFSDEARNLLSSFVTTVYRVPRKSLKPRVGLGYLQRFLHDKLASDMRSFFQVAKTTPEKLGEHLTKAVEETQRIDAIQDMPVDEAFPKGWNKVPPVLKEKTGLAWLDGFLNGGDAANDVYGLAAPIGTCKTLLAVQLGARAARKFGIEYEAACRRGERDPVLKLSYHISYEEPLEMLRVRAISYLGSIDRDNVESGDVDDLSRRTNLRPYEREMFNFGEGAVQAEYDRWKTAQRRLNLNWRPIDFTSLA